MNFEPLKKTSLHQVKNMELGIRGSLSLWMSQMNSTNKQMMEYFSLLLCYYSVGQVSIGLDQKS